MTMQGNWTDQQLKYIQFLARGKKTKDGQERSEQQFADAIGVDFATLWRWKQKDGFAEALIDASLKSIAPVLPAITNGLAGKAAGDKRFKQIDTPAANLVLKMYGMLTEKQQVQAEVQNKVSGTLGVVTAKSDEELDAIITGGAGV